MPPWPHLLILVEHVSIDVQETRAKPEGQNVPQRSLCGVWALSWFSFLFFFWSFDSLLVLSF